MFDMRRREFIILLGGATVALPLSAYAQQNRKVPRIGVLWHAGNEEEEAPYLAALRRGFSDLGYVEGQRYVLEQRFANEEYERFNSLAADLVSQKVDVLVAVSPAAAMAAKRTNTTLPVVFVIHPDPVGSKLVDSLARPGGNITGLSNQIIELSAKRLQYFTEAVSGLSQIGLLVNPRDADNARRSVEEMVEGAAKLKLSTQVAEARTPNDIGPAFSKLADARVDGVITTLDSMFNNERDRIANLALKHRLPTMVHTGEMVKSGGLISYGADYLDLFRHAPEYVDRILKGTKPADLPVQQSTKFVLIVNLKTAKALGLEIPPSLLARADEVIE
jgi:putative ABC transport system substrate-binding protein